MIRRMTPGLVLRPLTALLLVSLLVLPGCAYFNTFYHARKFYGQAEKIDREAAENSNASTGTASRASDLYNRCIEKCQKVMENYPGSRWQDDASLLMGKAYYGKVDYLNARREFTRFIGRFPESSLRPEAYFWLGLTDYTEGDFEAARGSWDLLVAEFPDYDGMEDVAFYRAEALRSERRWSESVEAYQAFLEEYPDKDRSTEARLALGSVLIERGDYDQAEEVFTHVVDKSRDPDDEFAAKLQLGQTNELKGEFEASLTIYTGLALKLDPKVLNGRITKEEREANRAAELEALAMAAADSAFNAGFQLSPEDSAAQAAEASLAEQEGTAFDPSDPRAVPSNQGEGGDDEEDGEPRLATFQQEQLLRVQSNRIPLQINHPNYAMLAQVILREGRVLAQMDRGEEAILAYEQVISEYARTPFAAEAQYRIGYTYEVYLEDFENAGDAYKLVASQGRSSFSEDAVRRASTLDTMRRLSLALNDSTNVEQAAAAEARFIRAELFLYQQDRPEKAIEEYLAIQADYPGTDWAAKALLAEAWVRINKLDDRARGQARYAQVMREFPDSEYGHFATRIVKGPEKEPEDTEFAGPVLTDLLTPANLASVAMRDSVLYAAVRAWDDSVAVAQAALLAETQGEEGGLGSPGSPVIPAAAGAAVVGGGLTQPSGATFTRSGLDPFAVPDEGHSPIMNAWDREPERAGVWGTPEIPGATGGGTQAAVPVTPPGGPGATPTQTAAGAVGTPASPNPGAPPSVATPTATPTSTPASGTETGSTPAERPDATSGEKKPPAKPNPDATKPPAKGKPKPDAKTEEAPPPPPEEEPKPDADDEPEKDDDGGGRDHG